MNGFLGTRASLMLDVVFLAMFAVLPILGISVWLVRVRRAYELHKRIQLLLGFVLLTTVTLFEIDMRMNGWRDRAVASPYYGTERTTGWVDRALYVHLVFAISTAVLWGVVLWRAWRRFPRPAAPGAHSGSHVFWARLAACDMVATSVTGWFFYWLAFVAKASGD